MKTFFSEDKIENGGIPIFFNNKKIIKIRYSFQTTYKAYFQESLFFHALNKIIILFLNMKATKVVQSIVKNGFGVLPEFLSPKECDLAVKQIDRLIDEYEPEKEHMSVFSVNDKHQKNEYFLGSADKVRFFFEEMAVKNGQFVRPKRHSINKIGHALHQQNKLFASFTYKNEVKEICRGLNNDDPLVVQSMAILKPPYIGGEVPEHQDSSYLYDQPESLLAFWIPLQDATLQNGCLWGIPGSHQGKLYKRSKVDWDDRSSKMDNLHEKNYRDEDFLPFEMKRGSLAVFPGRFLHKSLANTSPHSRYAYTWHLKKNSTEWSKQNWLQREKFPHLSFTY